MNINYIQKALKLTLLLTLPLGGLLGGLTSCTEPTSSLVAFVEDNTLSTPNDTLYSLMGIITKMQKVADRTVVLGDIRGDLTSLTSAADINLQQLADFTADASNPYNNISDYYAIIQNCNYYLTTADTSLTKRGEKVFAKEYAVIKAYRAWTYLQLAINYGEVPFFTTPLLTELEANPNLYPKYDVEKIANYFIDDLAPYVDTETPSYGSINGLDSKYFYIPVRVLLGDLCLWAGRYTEAATYYHAYLTKLGNTRPTGTARVSWETKDFEDVSDGYASQFSSSGINNQETVTIIPMEEKEFNGTMSYLDDIFNSTEDNNYFYQATHSKAYDQLSQSQKYTFLYTDPTTQLPDTLFPADTKVFESEQLRGDLRQQSVFTLRNQASGSANISSIRQTVQKHRSYHVCIYRLQQIYLRYAEALNRAGYPSAAFAVLKYGLCKDNNELYLTAEERAEAGELISFSEYTFTRDNTQGIHARGCGDCKANNDYCIPALASKSDSILYVENAICDEMALETAAEGTRFYDLMRLSMHRSDPTFLANKVANRDGSLNSSLYNKLSDKKNWYLPIE